MPETYTSGIWIVKEGEEDAFVAAWKELAQWATMPGAGTPQDGKPANAGIRSRKTP